MTGSRAMNSHIKRDTALGTRVIESTSNVATAVGCTYTRVWFGYYMVTIGPRHHTFGT